MKKIFSVAIVLIMVCTCLVAFAACNQTKDYYDAITKTLKLNKVYEGKSFLTDGVGKARVDSYTDGDTTRFVLAQGDTIIIRYYEVDTPESTGGVEKWGKAASNFVKSRLSAATEVVLEATGERAVKDNYGTRYLGYVWYKTESDSNLKNLNLELVENGFSLNQGQNTSAYPYYSYFAKAESAAKKYKLHIHSYDDDPLFSEDPIDITLKEFAEFEKAYGDPNDKNSGDKENNLAFYNPESESGGKLRFTAALTSLYISKSGTYTYTATAFDPTTNEEYQLNVYTMYSNSPGSSMQIGHLYVITGDLQLHYGKFQVSGIQYNEILSIKNATVRQQSNYYLTFDSSVKYIKQYAATLYGDVTVTEVQAVKDGVLTFVGTANQATKDGFKAEAKTFTFSVKVSDGQAGRISVGSVLSLTGYQLVDKSGNITIANFNNISIK